MEASAGNAINQIKNTDIKLGKVFASSGSGRYYGTVEPHQLPMNKRSIKAGNAIDWALIHVSTGARIGSNLIAEDLRFFGDTCPTVGRTIRSAELADTEAGAKLYKKGRNGTYVGTVSHYSVEICLEGRLFRAAVVMPTNVGPFLFSGDSGSFCFDELGTF